MLDFPRWKVILISLVCLWGILASLPNFLTEEQANGLSGFLPSDQVNLGLDLQGGTHMLLTVDVESVIEERLENLVGDVRQALRPQRIGYVDLGVSGQAVTFRLRDPADMPEALRLVRAISQPLASTVFVGGTQELIVDAVSDTRISITLTDEGVLQRRSNAVQQSIEVIRRRIDETGTLEPTIQRQGEDRILLQVPGLADPAELKKRLNTEAKLSFHLVDTTVTPTDIQRGRVPPGTRIMQVANGGGQVALKFPAMVSGENLIDAQPSFDISNRPVVSFRFDNTGARKFADVTRTNVGRQFAIVLDDEAISVPVINEPILGGSGQIAGSFTVQTASDLAVLLRAGALPAKLTIEEERSVGPDLGADSIAAGKRAALIGLSAVLVFMVLSYGWFGLAANVALAFNILLLFGGLSLLNATLTLPGIAGIVLTIGMAVDANVLVFERIREEYRAGRPPLHALEQGYAQAMSTILDANITTFIAAAILFQLGSGPVKGFAVTLAIGIVTSVFTAIMLTRMILVLWMRRRRPATLVI